MSTGTAQRVLVIDVSPPTAAWRKTLPRAQNLVRTMAAAALRYGFQNAPLRRRQRGRRPSLERRGFEVSIVLTGNAVVHRLNRVYRHKDKPTNVLSFPADAPPSGPWPLGDVVIAYGVAATEARAEGKTLAAHLAHLVLHGVLHLLGYDHQDDRDGIVMERLESVIMARMGFDDPYGARTPARRPRNKTRGKAQGESKPRQRRTGAAQKPQTRSKRQS